jgi:hypothetical protein
LGRSHKSKAKKGEVIFIYWWLEKIEETETFVFYGYGWRKGNVTGKLSLSKLDNTVTLIQLADGDNEGFFEKLAEHVRHIIAKENYPNCRAVATG